MKTNITRILDINSNEVPRKFIELLNYCECYEDLKSVQPIYNSFDLLEDEESFGDIFKGTNLDLLREIEGLCVANECDYFRITF